MARHMFHILLALICSAGCVQLTHAQTRRVQGGEFFFDTDPGIGAATGFIAADGSFDEVFEAAAGPAGELSTGLHTLHVRLRDASGNWSPAFRTVVSVEAPSVPLRNVAITQAEYFWDADPGTGSATAMLAFDGAFNEALEQVFADAQSVPATGLHSLNVRVRGSDGAWGPLFRTVVAVEAPSVPISPAMVAQAEYYWDTDPGQGNATALSAADGSMNEAFEQAVASSSTLFLDEGPHVLGVRMKDANGNWSPDFRSVVHLEVDPAAVRLAAKVVLEGPYSANTGLMSDALRAAQLLPTGEPYSALGYPFVGGGAESTTLPILAGSGQDAIVDWVVLELCDMNDPTIVVTSRGALLQRDGDVVDVNGSSAVSVAAVPGNYHVAIRHRNHLGVMTATPVALGAATTTIDLRLLDQATFGIDARKSITGAFPVQALWAGDVTFDRSLKYTGQDNDRDPILSAIGGVVPTNTTNGYLPEDVNMDGTVKYTGLNNDRDPILQNIGGVVPTNVRMEQAP
jgi:hypothetical protein